MKGLLYKNMLLIVRQFKRLLILSLLFLVMTVLGRLRDCDAQYVCRVGSSIG